VEVRCRRDLAQNVGKPRAAEPATRPAPPACCSYRCLAQSRLAGSLVVGISP
jgi:hypothetical protein